MSDSSCRHDVTTALTVEESGAQGGWDGHSRYSVLLVLEASSTEVVPVGYPQGFVFFARILPQQKFLFEFYNGARVAGATKQKRNHGAPFYLSLFSPQASARATAGTPTAGRRSRSWKSDT